MCATGVFFFTREGGVFFLHERVTSVQHVCSMSTFDSELTRRSATIDTINSMNGNILCAGAIIVRIHAGANYTQQQYSYERLFS